MIPELLQQDLTHEPERQQLSTPLHGVHTQWKSFDPEERECWGRRNLLSCQEAVAVNREYG